jgi:hypothetical protein
VLSLMEELTGTDQLYEERDAM